MSLRVAATAKAAEAFAWLHERELIPNVDHVVLADDGSAPPEGRDTNVLWRHVDSPLTPWVSTAVAQLPHLAWLASDFVGVDPLPMTEIHERKITVTNGRGLYSRPIAEWVVLHLLTAVKDYRHFVRNSDAGVWERTPPSLRGLRGATVLVIGMGAIGCEVAELLGPFGARVVGAVHRERAEIPPFVDRLVVGDAWRAELPHADFIVLAAPATARTRGMIDADAFAALPPHAWLINIARGALVDENALLSALDDGRLAGAALDAVVTEPLPPTSPFWGRPNVTVTPHHTWSAQDTRENAWQLFADNLRRYVRGEPLTNLVDHAIGY